MYLFKHVYRSKFLKVVQALLPIESVKAVFTITISFYFFFFLNNIFKYLKLFLILSFIMADSASTTAVYMKPRHNPTSAPIRWEPVPIAPPPGDEEDEFDVASAKRPIYHEVNDESKVVFINGEPDMEGEVNNCFKEPGLLYRIVDKKTKTWAFYNDSLSFEIHVLCTFGKLTKIKALENTKLSENEDGELVAEVVVNPCETERFVSGFINGFTMKFRAAPLSDSYYSTRAELNYEKQIKADIDAIKEIAGDETNSEKILTICLENNLQFVDLEFPPVQSSIDRGATRPFKQLTWARPSQYLDPRLRSQIRLFRNKITPLEISQGELGDLWFICALGAQAEDSNAVYNMFRNPKGADRGRRERALGAYRVSFNKNGVWKSVIVDDYLPVVVHTPKFAHSKDACELWPSILEKAFAKIHGSYAAIQSGDPVHALSDMTGFPSMRFDIAFAEASTSDKKELFYKWVEWSAAKYPIMITTPGKAPAIRPGTQNVPDFSEDPELEHMMAGTGLLPGHAYGVIQAAEFPDEGFHLVKIRNLWKHGDDWKGEWSQDSPLWDDHPNIAQELNFNRNDKTSIWMPWESVLKYFNGGGVVFKKKHSFDYRIPFTFADARPGVVFEIKVKNPTTLCFSIANKDHCNRQKEAGEHHEYPPLMLSLATKQDERDDVYGVILNSSSDITQPSTEKWTFLQCREVSMIAELTPAESPYLLIPRMMDNFTADPEEYEGAEFINRYQEIFPDAPNPEQEIPVVLSIQSDVSFSGVGENSIVFRKLGGVNSVFENFPKFPTDDLCDLESIRFHTKEPSKGYSKEKVGYYVC